MTDTNSADASGAPTLKVHDRPSEQIIATAAKTETITADDGTKLTLRTPGYLAQFQLLEALGPELSLNQAFVQMCQPLLYVGEIAKPGQAAAPAFMPQSKDQVYGLISELGEKAMDALVVWYGTNVIEPQARAMAEAQSAAEQKARLKNA